MQTVSLYTNDNSWFFCCFKSRMDLLGGGGGGGGRGCTPLLALARWGAGGGGQIFHDKADKY